MMTRTCVVPETRSTRNVRPAAVADQFYPGQPSVLEHQVDDFLREGEERVVRSIVHPKALIVPHAGSSGRPSPVLSMTNDKWVWLTFRTAQLSHLRLSNMASLRLSVFA